jgi:hypothetical protein
MYGGETTRRGRKSYPASPPECMKKSETEHKFGFRSGLASSNHAERTSREFIFHAISFQYRKSETVIRKM